MTVERILSCPVRVLTQAKREHFFEHGCVGIKLLAEHPRAWQIPLDWSDGYTSIYAAHSREDKAMT